MIPTPESTRISKGRERPFENGHSHVGQEKIMKSKVMLFLSVALLCGCSKVQDDGHWEFRHKNGATVSGVYKTSGGHSDAIVSNDWSGVLVSFWPTGHKVCEEEWLSGRRHGKCYYWESDGTPISRFHYTDGNKSGVWVDLHRNGMTNFVLHYNSSGEKHGLYQSWHFNGTPRNRGVFSDGKKTGVWTERNVAGSVLQKHDFGDGTQQSKQN
jgi:hypothetical protein